MAACAAAIRRGLRRRRPLSGLCLASGSASLVAEERLDQRGGDHLISAEARQASRALLGEQAMEGDRVRDRSQHAQRKKSPQVLLESSEPYLDLHTKLFNMSSGHKFDSANRKTTHIVDSELPDSQVCGFNSKPSCWTAWVDKEREVTNLTEKTRKTEGKKSQRK